MHVIHPFPWIFKKYLICGTPLNVCSSPRVWSWNSQRLHAGCFWKRQCWTNQCSGHLRTILLIVLGTKRGWIMYLEKDWIYLVGTNIRNTHTHTHTPHTHSPIHNWILKLSYILWNNCESNGFLKTHIREAKWWIFSTFCIGYILVTISRSVGVVRYKNARSYPWY